MPGLFDFSEERAFAAHLVAHLSQQLPPQHLAEESIGKLSVNKVTRLLERTYQEASRKFGDKRPGLVRRSVLANAFKWGLNEKGYPSNFVDLATEGLVMEITRFRK